METFATSGFELGALLAPELAGAVTVVSQRPRGDPHAAEPGVGPFALALNAAASTEPKAATLPASGNLLPLFDRVLVAAQAVEPAPTQPAPDSAPSPGLPAGSRPAMLSDLNGPLQTAVAASGESASIATAGDGAASIKAAQPASVELVSSNAAQATVSLDANATKLASTVSDNAAEVIRLVTKQADVKTSGSANNASTHDMPDQGSGEQATGRATVNREALQPLMPELSRQLSSAAAATESASVSAAMPIARNLQRQEGSARTTELGAGAVSAAAIVTDASSTQSVDAPKFTAELAAGSEARLPNALADRLSWMIDHNLGEARIKLNPPQLGAIDIKITIAEEQTFVQFTASQAGAREMIESALPRLRDLLGAAGLAFGGATVGGETPNREQPEVRRSTLPELEPLDVVEPAIRALRPTDGRIDIYA